MSIKYIFLKFFALIITPFVVFWLNAKSQNYPLNPSPYWHSGSSLCADSVRNLIWSDEFNDSIIDNTKWFTFMPHWLQNNNGQWYTDDQAPYCRLMHGYEDKQTGNCMVFKDQNIQLENGVCRLLIKKEDSYWMGYQRPYSGAVLNSKISFSGFGSYEIRAKMNHGQHLYYAFWLFGGHTSALQDLGGTEIDIFEFFNENPFYKLLFNLIKWKNNKAIAHAYENVMVNTDNWHVYRCDFSMFFVQLYIDDILVKSIPRLLIKKKSENQCNLESGSYKESAYFPYVEEKDRDRLNIIINCGVMRPTKLRRKKQWIHPQTPDSAAMVIDYVRVYTLNKK